MYQVTRHKKAHIYAHNFSVSFFSSSETHQFRHLDGCQAIGINSFSTCSFNTLHFYSYHTTQKVYPYHDRHYYHAISLLVVVLQTNQEHTAKGKGLSLLSYYTFLVSKRTWHSCHGLASTALIHISWVLKRSGTRAKERGLSFAALIHIFCILY